LYRDAICSLGFGLPKSGGLIEYKHINAITLRIQHKNKLIAAVTKKTI